MGFIFRAVAVLAAHGVADAAAAPVAQNATGAGPEGLWHLLSPELQHSLAGVLTNHGAQKGLEDPDVDAFMSNLLHDEIETQVKAQAAEDEQWKKHLEEEEKAAKEAEAIAKAEDEKRRAEHEKQMQEMEAAREARAAQREAEREADKLKREAEDKQHQKEEEARQRSHDEYMAKSKARREASQKRRAEMEERHAKNWERAKSLLGQVHEELEVATGGWRDAPFWDDFFRTSSAATRFSQLGFSHIEPALRASSLLPEHKVLVLEPRGASLADRLAEEIRGASSQAEANGYGAESDESKDVVVEVGLLDAMAMGDQAEEKSKLGALKSASARLAKLVKPGGTWISISAVPPTLRVPLLGRLAGGSFSLPSEKEDASAGTHTVVLSAANASTKGKTGLRGSAQVADMLLYGSEDVHVWAYRMKRGNDSRNEQFEGASSSADDLLDMIRLQRPAARDDL